MAVYQPTKLAALEGLGRTERGAALHVGGVYQDGRVRYGIPVPDGLSLLARHDPQARIRGLDAVPARDRPPVNVVRFAFQAMVGIGTLLALLGVATILVWWRHGRLPEHRLFAPAVIVAGPAALVALLCGWVTTEVGRQPWVVYEVLRTSQAVTDAGGLPVAFALLLATYLALLGGVVWLLRRLARRPPEAELEGAGPVVAA